MDCTRLEHRRPVWLLALAAVMACGCQTVKTPEEKIAKSNLPREFTKVSMPDYVVEPPDLLIVEVLISVELSYVNNAFVVLDWYLE